jgi:voltage-gated potassium channel
LVYFVYWLALSVHWLAIGGLALRGLPPAADGLKEYLHSLYWCVSTLTTIGYVDIKPTTNIEFVYAMAVMIFGVGMYGYVIANVSTIIVNLQPARVRYLENMEKLGAFMRYRGIPGGLRHRIRDYYAYIWEQRLGYDESSIIQGLPPGLLADVSLFLKRDVIQKVPFFQGASEDLIREIALVMRPVVYTPGDTVFHAGEPGGAMYFISHGRLQVIGRDDRTVLATLSDGEFFGEMALLLNQPRNATVKAIGYCDLYLLAKPGFDAIVERYPEFAAHIHAMMAGRQEGRH